jgi:hypothetical protein
MMLMSQQQQQQLLLKQCARMTLLHGRPHTLHDYEALHSELSSIWEAGRFSATSAAMLMHGVHVCPRAENRMLMACPFPAVALVQLSQLTAVDYSSSSSSSSSQPLSSAAAALRAAGYPASPALSRPALQRTAQAAAAAAVDAGASGPGSAPGIATPVDVNGPNLHLHNSSSSSSSSSRRRWLQQQQQRIMPTAVESFAGISSAAPVGTSAIAVGPSHLLQASGSLITVTNISSSTGSRIPNSSRSVHLASLMAGAAADCQDVFDPSAVFDHAAGRYIVTATCGGLGRVLMAASSSSDANGAWFVFGLVADGVMSSLACIQPVQESAVVDYTQVSCSYQDMLYHSTLRSSRLWPLSAVENELFAQRAACVLVLWFSVAVQQMV